VERLGRRRLLSSKEVAASPTNTRALVAGLVIGRQRPGTADGTCFVTLEDETGLVNVIVWGRDFDAWRATVVTCSFLLFEGEVERQGLVVHLIAKAVTGITARMRQEGPVQLGFPFKSRSFH
jgi:error-prone DNA polymerase